MRGRRVVVAEDDSALRVAVTAVLAYELGVHAVGAPDGAGALRLIEEGPPSLLLTDLQMPGMDGYELIRWLKANPATRALPIVATSAAGSRDRALFAGCDAFVAKPFDLDDLVGVVRRLLEAAP